MKKVKLPREVAEAIETLRKSGDENLPFGINDAFILWESCCCDDVKWQTLNRYVKEGDNIFKVADALRYGYEIEPDPITVTVTEDQIEKVKGLYHSLDPTAVGFKNGWRLGFTAALDAVGIKIQGVND